MLTGALTTVNIQVFEVDGSSGVAMPVVDAATHVTGFQIVLNAGQARLYLFNHPAVWAGADHTNNLKTDDQTLSRSASSGSVSDRQPLAPTYK